MKKYSSFKSHQLLTENFRRFISEDEDPEELNEFVLGGLETAILAGLAGVVLNNFSKKRPVVHVEKGGVNIDYDSTKLALFQLPGFVEMIAMGGMGMLAKSAVGEKLKKLFGGLQNTKQGEEISDTLDSLTSESEPPLDPELTETYMEAVGSNPEFDRALDELLTMVTSDEVGEEDIAGKEAEISNILAQIAGDLPQAELVDAEELQEKIMADDEGNIAPGQTDLQGNPIDAGKGGKPQSVLDKIRQRMKDRKEKEKKERISKTIARDDRIRQIRKDRERKRKGKTDSKEEEEEFRLPHAGVTATGRDGQTLHAKGGPMRENKKKVSQRKYSSFDKQRLITENFRRSLMEEAEEIEESEQITMKTVLDTQDRRRREREATSESLDEEAERTAAGNIAQWAREKYATVGKDGFPIFDEESAIAAIKLRGNATEAEQETILNKAHEFAPDEANAARDKDKKGKKKKNEGHLRKKSGKKIVVGISRRKKKEGR